MKMNRTLIFLVTFVLTIMALTTSTAAWISLPRIDTFDNIQFNVIKDATLEISFDGINYYEEITPEIMKQYMMDQLGSGDFTSQDGINFETIHDAELPYVEFDIYFRASRSAANCIYLVNNVSTKYDYEYVQSNKVDGTYAISQGVYWTTGYEFDNGYGDIVKKNETRMYYSANALRISFHEQNVKNSYLTKEDTRTNLASFIFDPSEDESRGFGKEFGAYDYYQKYLNSNLKVPTDIPYTLYKLSNWDDETKTLDDNSTLVGTFQQGIENNQPCKYAHTKVTMWFEGWDPDCIDASLFDLVTVQLKFICADLA